VRGRDSEGQPVAEEELLEAAQIVEEPELTTEQVKGRAAAGVFLLAGRDVAVRAIGLAGNVVLARLLVPEDFGIVAVGLVVINVANFVTDAGLGLGLVRRKESPTVREMRSVVGLQLAAASAIATVAAAVTLGIGGDARITALMVLALPLMALRTPGLIYLDRQLDFSIQVRVELIETLAYVAWAITTAALGWGAWSLASGAVVKAAVGALSVARLTPLGLIRPTLDIAAVRPLLGFGARFQALGLLQLGQQVALTACIGAVGGLTSLGLWSLAERVLQLPQLLFRPLWGIGIPAYSRLLQAGEDVGRLVQRSVTTLAVVGGVVLAPLGGTATAYIPLVFGEKWSEAAEILPGACMALAISAPVNICMVAMLYAAGDAATPLRASIVHAFVRLPLALVGLHYFGLWALGAAWFAAQAVELPIVVRRTRTVVGLPVGREIVLPVLATATAGGAAWAVVDALDRGVPALAAGVGVSWLLFGTIMAVGDRPALRVAGEMSVRAWRSTVDRMRGRHTESERVVSSPGS
jgi:O-antigen/teichoic acid export membrane protein